MRYKVLIIALLVAVAGLAIFAYKWRVLGFPLQSDGVTEVWTVEVRVGFEPGPGPVKAGLYIPGLTPGFAILDENFVSRGFGFTTRYVSGGREVQWARRRSRGPQTLYYRAVIYKDPTRIESDTTPPFPPMEPNTELDSCSNWLVTLASISVSENACSHRAPAELSTALLA